MHRILAVNPGATSTKFGLFAGVESLFRETLRHTAKELASFPTLADQLPFRASLIRQALAARGVALGELSAVAGRGGLMRPVAGGVYLVDEAMCQDLLPGVQGEHAANLGAPLARELARAASEAAGRPVPAFVVDPVATDEFEPLARYSGLPELPRRSLCHALNIKAVARRFAASLGRCYEELNLVVAHLGSGFSTAALRGGRIVDAVGDEEGAFSPVRSGGLPSRSLVVLATGGRLSREELLRRLMQEGGLRAYLGTDDALSIEARIAQGDDEARRVYQAMAYQVAKDIGALATVLCGRLDAILLTGGLARSALLTGWITERVRHLAPVHLFPGEEELQALAEGAVRVLSGVEEAKSYTAD
ncbi:MAG TPA: butyrate kinase [Firmicutes bacterium]|nr:butyrate kinase [Bacillota bacterium]